MTTIILLEQHIENDCESPMRVIARAEVHESYSSARAAMAGRFRAGANHPDATRGHMNEDNASWAIDARALDFPHDGEVRVCLDIVIAE